MGDDLMSDDCQINIPPSFFALHTDARQRLSAPIGTVRARYELCEDLATHLIAQAQMLHHVAMPSEDEILRRIREGLLAPESGVSAAEATWIVRRLAELLNWPAPA
jgi:hypothetical protein